MPAVLSISVSPKDCFFDKLPAWTESETFSVFCAQKNCGFQLGKSCGGFPARAIAFFP